MYKKILITLLIAFAIGGITKLVGQDTLSLTGTTKVNFTLNRSVDFYFIGCTRYATQNAERTITNVGKVVFKTNGSGYIIPVSNYTNTWKYYGQNCGYPERTFHFKQSQPDTGSGGGGGSGVKKIMPLGNSITDGYDEPGGYRIPLYEKLIANNKSFDYVGSMYNGWEMPEGYRDHEGHNGFTIDEITDLINSGILATYNPDIILLMIGANDLNRNLNRSDAPRRLDSLIGVIRGKLPNVKIVVSAICPIYSNSYGSVTQAQIQTYNTAIAAKVAARSAAGQAVFLCDNYTGMSSGDFYDGIHPNVQGHVKIGNKWYNCMVANQLL